MSSPADATVEVSRALANLVQSRLLTRRSTDRITRTLRAELTCTTDDLNALLSILDGLIHLIDQSLVPAARRDNLALGTTSLHLEGLLPSLRELRITTSAARRALRLAEASIPEAGVISTSARAFFPGTGRRRCVVLAVEKVRAYLRQKKPVPLR